MSSPTPPRIRRSAQRATFREWCALSALLACLAGVLGYAGGLGRPDQTLYDAALKLMPRAPAGDIVIVAIDEKSLAEIGRWPWPRAVHATLVEKISASGPRAIGLDLILAEPETAAPGNPGSQGDPALARALAQSGKVVLPVLLEARTREGRRELHTSLPAPPLAAAALGHIHLEIDADGIARSVFLREGPGPAAQAGQAISGAAPGWPHFALALRDLATGTPLTALPGERNPAVTPAAGAPAGAVSMDAGRWSRDYWMHIPFAGPPGTYAQVSYVDVLKGAVPAQQLAGKYVLVGATAAGLGDAFPTPVSGQTRTMPGIEISANVLDTLNNGGAIARAGAWTNALLSMLPVLALMSGLLLFSPRRGLLLAGAMFAATLLFSYLLMRAGGLWFAPAAALSCLALAYPLWSWRRLEATIKYLGAEFMRLDAEPRILPERRFRAAPPGADLVERRILALEGAAQHLRDVRRFVSDALESLPDAALVADRDGSVLLANRAAAALFGAGAPGELRDARVAALIASVADAEAGTPAPGWEQLQALAAAPGTADAASPAAGATLELRTRGGRDLLVHCAPCAGADGVLVGSIVTLIDVSPLREAERGREEVLAFLSHDMRSPQSSILALLELHELDPDDNPKEDVHQRIAQYAHRTLELSEQFLQMARAETKQYEIESIDLGALAEEAVEEAWTAAQQKDIALDLQFDGEPVPVRADPAMLRRALINLLTNAVKYSPEHTRVTIVVQAQAEWQVCRVTDQGYGMSEDNLAHLFERFRRFSRPGQPKAQGAGLGMAFVKTVVEKHGGRIQVESRLDHGSSFTLELPPAA